jgi:hypothetical protein
MGPRRPVAPLRRPLLAIASPAPVPAKPLRISRGHFWASATGESACFSPPRESVTESSKRAALVELCVCGGGARGCVLHVSGLLQKPHHLGLFGALDCGVSIFCNHQQPTARRTDTQDTRHKETNNKRQTACSGSSCLLLLAACCIAALAHGALPMALLAAGSPSPVGRWPLGAICEGLETHCWCCHLLAPT